MIQREVAEVVIPLLDLTLQRFIEAAVAASPDDGECDRLLGPAWIALMSILAEIGRAHPDLDVTADDREPRNYPESTEPPLPIGIDFAERALERARSLVDRAVEAIQAGAPTLNEPSAIGALSDEFSAARLAIDAAMESLAAARPGGQT